MVSNIEIVVMDPQFYKYTDVVAMLLYTEMSHSHQKGSDEATQKSAYKFCWNPYFIHPEERNEVREHPPCHLSCQELTRSL